MFKVDKIAKMRIDSLVVCYVIAALSPRTFKDWAKPNVVRLKISSDFGNFAGNEFEIAKCHGVDLINQRAFWHKNIVSNYERSGAIEGWGSVWTFDGRYVMMVEVGSST